MSMWEATYVSHGPSGSSSVLTSALPLFSRPFQGWVVFKVRRIEDGRIRRAISEAFCIAYGLQAIALLRAQLAVPDSHTLWNTAGWLSFACLALFYGYCRWFKTIKVFQLPGSRG